MEVRHGGSVTWGFQDYQLRSLARKTKYGPQARGRVRGKTTEGYTPSGHGTLPAY
jgi:hypothetical protein